jgi:hypothetical protein
MCVHLSTNGSFVSTQTGSLVAVDEKGAVIMSSGAPEAVLRCVLAAAEDTGLVFREEALTSQELSIADFSIIGVKGCSGAWTLGKLFEYKNRGLVTIWQHHQQHQHRQRPMQFLSTLNTLLKRGIDCHPIHFPS